MIRSIELYPGKDERDAGKGFHCAELLFILRDDDSVATFAVRTNWLPADMRPGFIRPDPQPRALDLTFHFPQPTLTATQERRETCLYLAMPCHSIFDRKHGESLLNALLTGGSNSLWMMFEKLFTEEIRINNPRRAI